jgi:hypothetical protein
MINFIIDFKNLSDKDLYKYCKTIGFNARKWHRRFMATIPEVFKRRLYKKYGCCSIHEFTAKMAGVSHDNTDEVLRVSEKFKELPKMKALIGEVGLSKLKIVACIATKDTDSFWAEKVKNMTKSSLEIYAREIKRKETEAEKIIYNPVLQPITQKFPGESRVENLNSPQQQEQINMFDSRKSIPQNNNDARVENIQNHDKKAFTIQIDPETEFELRKFKLQLEKNKKEPVDWNFTLKEMVKRATNEKTVKEKNILKKELSSNKQDFHKNLHQTSKSVPASEPRTKNLKSQQTVVTSGIQPKTKPVSRYIPAKIKHDLDQKYNGQCAYRGCSKPAEHIHHKDRFSKTKNHKNLIPLCKTHHDLIHQTSTIDQIFNKLKSEFVVSSG